MGAIFGLIGEGSLSEVRGMGERMPHRGSGVQVWSPAPQVYFGCRGTIQTGTPRNLAADAQLDEQTTTDIARALESGVLALSAINGYFSLAFWDDVRSNVVLACDTSGFKSLYYVKLPGRVAFASEYKALLALDDVRAELNLDSAQHYLATRSFRMDQPLLSGVRSLTAGSVLFVRGDEALVRNYWTPARRIEQRPPADFAREVRQTLERVITRQSSKFSRVGITLSGGLDSACVVALLRKVRPDLHLSSYTVGFGPEDPEVQGGRELATTFGTQHHEISFDPEQIHKRLPSLVWLMEDCAGREESLLMHLVLCEASRFESVVFGGYGADMLFGGMPRYRLMRMRDAMPWLRKPISEVFQLTQTGVPPRTLIGKLGQRLLQGANGYPPPNVVGAGGMAHVADDLPLDEFISRQMCEAQDSGYLEPSLETSGVEFRDPFQSTEMMDLALRIPGRYNVSFRKQKMILRQAVADLMPAELRKRPKSLQRVRHDLQMSNVLDDMASKLLSADAVKARGIVAPHYVRRLRDRDPDQPYSSERLYRLWTLVCLELWQRQFIDHRGRSDAVVSAGERRRA